MRKSILLVVLLLVGCSKIYPNNILTTPSFTTKSVITSIKLTMKNTELVPTNTNLPTITQTLMPSRIPMMNKNDIAKYLLSINNLGKCENPCWWKIHLGETKWADLENILGSMQITARKASDGSNAEAESPFIDWRIQIKDLPDNFINEHFKTNIDLFTQKDIVSYITVSTEIGVNRLGYLDAFQQTWNEFSPERVLNNYSDPTRIYYSYGYEPGDYPAPYAYTLWLIYDQRGFAIAYSGVNKPNYSNICMSFSNSQNSIPGIAFYIKAPNIQSSIEDLPKYYRWEGIPTLKETTWMEIPEFVEQMTSNNHPGCISKSVQKRKTIVDGPSIIGKWELRGDGTSPTTTYITYQEDGTYLLNVIDKISKTIVYTKTSGYIFDNNYIYYNDGKGERYSEKYFLQEDNNVLITYNNGNVSWKRIK
jgi:hypothetical protein